MRVALVSGHFEPELTAIAEFVARLRDELNRHGAAARVVEQRRWDVLGVARLAQQLRRERPDVVHVHFAPSQFAWSGAVGLLPAMLGGAAPIVTTLHEYGWWQWPGSRLARSLLRPLWRVTEPARLWDREAGLLTLRSARVVATNRWHAREVSRRLPGVSPALVPIAANVGAPWEGTAQQARRELRVPDGRTLLAFFGFVHPIKGIPYLLEATAALRKDGHDVGLAIVGGFESLALPEPDARAWRDTVFEMIADHALEEVTTVTGRLPAVEVSRWLRAADVGVLPMNEGVTGKSGSLLTMFAHRLPTVATVATPPDPLVQDRREALLVPPRDSEALADAITEVLQDPMLAAALGERGHELWEERDWPVIARQHVEIYSAVTRAA